MKKGNILQQLETHVDKIVLGVIGLVSLVILWVYVIGNPYGQVVDGRKRSPGEIDPYVKVKADNLRGNLDNQSDPIVYDKTYLAQYTQSLQSPLGDMQSLSIPVPGSGGAAAVQEERIYALPEIIPLTDVAVGNLRGAAQKPTEDPGLGLGLGLQEMGYSTEAAQMEDVDLVTVSANFNVQALYNGFQQSFMNPRLKTAWKDTTLARPIFAKLELQRRRQLENGTWTEWENVPRAKNDTYKQLIEELPLTTDQLQVGVDLWMNQYTDKPIQRDILQPPAYSFLISRSQWLPPSYLQEAFDLIKKQEDLAQRQLREERAKQRQEMTNDPTGRRPENTRPTPTRPERRPPEARRGRENNPMFEMGMESPVVPQRPVRKERTLEDVKADAKKAMLDDKSDPQALRDSVLVWAHDDTTEPGQTYQYRLRLGVFNPIAGKNWVRPDQAQYDKQVVLWSPYTDPTSDVYVPKRIHIFPADLLAAKPDAGGLEGVKVDVAKYNLGRWRMQTFEVYPGQVIGQKAEVKPDPADSAMQGFGMELMPIADTMNPGQPQIVDFTTPFTVVDINHLVTWGSNAQRRSGYDTMLYYDVRQKLAQAAIGKNNWDSGLRKEYQDVQDEMDRAVQQQSPGVTPLPGPGGPVYPAERFMPPGA